MSPGNVRWLDGGAAQGGLESGITFGMPWPKGCYQPGQTFIVEANGQDYPLDSREIAVWEDGSLKWTVHSVGANIPHSNHYTVKGFSKQMEPAGVVIQRDADTISVLTNAGLQIRFPPAGGSSLFQGLSVNGHTVCSGATIIASINGREYSTIVRKTEIENATHTRVCIKISGHVVSDEAEEHLPFDLRVYLYSDASSIKIIHSFIHDLDPDQPLTSLGLRILVPLQQTELYNRHVRLGGSGGGILREEIQGLSGLRYGPTIQNRVDQTAGKAITLNRDEWSRTEFPVGLSYVPSWDSYSLSQLSSDGFTVKKRTKPGCSWVKVIGGTRADGTAYLGSARNGGLAVGMRHFWERYPTQLDLADLAKDEGSITMWLYSPLAEPLETAPYHDGLGLDSYSKQLEALDVTYEDYEPGFATANGIGRTNQFFLKPYTETPSNEELSVFSSSVRKPPRLVPTVQHMQSTDVFHGCWVPDFHSLGHTPSRRELEIEKNLDTLFNYYRDQVEQNRWYGFWDHGDIQHTYDPYRHAWRYDVGGYAWDNSELSSDLWLWLYFLHTGRGDVFEMAEAMTRHTGEVDVYHSGRFKGFGTRHSVQHFSDGSKQLRISNVLYRRIYYYLTGDERTGDLMCELQNCQESLLALDSHRKVQEHADIPDGFAMTNVGLDCGALAAAWLTAWERRIEGWVGARDRLMKMLDGLASLQHGIANNAVLLNTATGEIRACPPPTPEYAISHLSMLFGFPETVTELLDYARASYPSTVEKFRKVWLPYCRAYNGGSEVQLEEFGFEFPAHATWRQSHSTLTAMAAVEDRSDELGRAAWKQFFETDGYSEAHEWVVNRCSPPEFFAPGEEAPWVRTNEAARYGVSAMVNLARVGKFLQ